MTPSTPPSPSPSPPRPSRTLLRRVAIGLLAAMTALVVGMIVLWNWPSAFQAVSVRLACLATGMSVREVSVNGHRIPYLEREASGVSDGTAATTVVCLHGFGTSKESSFVLSQMFPGARFLAPDLPPFGEADVEAVERYDAQSLVEYIRGFVEATHASPCLMVGTSMGGALAAAYAAEHPTDVATLVLIAPAGVRAPVENEFVRNARGGGNPLRIASEADFDRVIDLVFEHPPATPSPIKAFLVEQALATREARDRAADTLGPWLLDDGITASLPTLTQPTLVLFGDCDRVIDPSCLGVFDASIPACEAVLVPRAGHVLFADAPLQTRDAIAAFLTNLPAAPAPDAAPMPDAQ